MVYIVLFIILVIIINLFYYKPSLDLVKYDDKYTLLLWYNHWDDYEGTVRKYIRLFAF